MTSRFLALFNLRAAYRRAFTGSDGERVLRDLARFCRANKSSVATSRVTGSVDPLATMLAEGRREVFLHISKVLRLTDEQINNLLEQNDAHTE